MDTAKLQSGLMPENFTVAYEGDHILVGSYGDRSIEYARAVWTETLKVCKEHSCFDILIVSRAPQPMPVLDGYEHSALFKELEIDSRYRIAFAELNDEARKVTRFVEDVLVNRGLPGRVFASEEEAREWLFPAGA